MTQTEAGATSPPAPRGALHLIAIFEAVKGLAALAAAIGLVGLLHRDLHQIAVSLLWRFHLDPELRYPALLVHYADLLSAVDLRKLGPIVVAYITIRLLEGYGLWNGKVWAEWLGALSGGLYVPFEIAHLAHRATFAGAAVLIGNLAVVAFLAYQLWLRR
jgi:uncharacterized membrane protein (DUF2068 family)